MMKEKGGGCYDGAIFDDGKLFIKKGLCA